MLVRRFDFRWAALALIIAATLALATVIFPAKAPAAGAATTVVVATAAQLTAALSAAKPGQIISLRDGTYVGKFVGSTAGTSSAPIILTGSRKAVLSTGSNTSGYALHLKAGYWRVTGLSVSKAQKGIVLDNSDNTVIDGVDVGTIGQEAIHVRTSSINVTISNSLVHDTGLSSPEYGEGIYIGSAKSNWSSIMGSSSTPDKSDYAIIKNNTITNTSAEGIDVKEGTKNGKILDNVFTRAGYSGKNSADSWVDIKGNGYLVSGNSGSVALLDAYQVHSVLSGWGGGNTFKGNGAVSAVPGYEVNIASSASGNVVYCQASNAARGLTNVTCR